MNSPHEFHIAKILHISLSSRVPYTCKCNIRRAHREQYLLLFFGINKLNWFDLAKVRILVLSFCVRHECLPLFRCFLFDIAEGACSILGKINYGFLDIYEHIDKDMYVNIAMYVGSILMCFMFTKISYTLLSKIVHIASVNSSAKVTYAVYASTMSYFFA